MDNEHQTILRMIYQIMEERAELKARGGFLEITHRFWIPGTVCKAGEEVFDVSARWAGRTQSLPYSTKQRALIDYLSRYSVGQTATQIAAGMNTHPFFVNYGKNARGRVKFKCKINRTLVKTYISQLRAIGSAGFQALSVNIDPFDFIESIETGKERRYRLRAFVQRKHVEY
jgi:hypothetical protein